MSVTHPERRLLRTREVAEILNVSPRTVYVWVAERRLPAIHLPPRTIRFDPDAVTSFIESRTIEGRGDER
ncbi:MAG: helix-turn-helix domain-containing protein [Phycisphaerales bacterium]|nr:MAG: helix-turn-helix domain-containing protein [Phycisphaerales bacterium]